MKQKLPLKNKIQEKLDEALKSRGIKPGEKPKVKSSIPKPGKKK
jgi:hypothetical protein